VSWRKYLICIVAGATIFACSSSNDSPIGQSSNTAENAFMRGDYATALAEWRPRAERGDPAAQYGLGYMYRHGQGVPQNSKEAGLWYKKAAMQGYVKAQIKLGLMYAKGDGFSQNYVQAHKWFNLAAAQGEKNAARARAKIEKYMTAVEIQEAKRLAHEWKPNK